MKHPIVGYIPLIWAVLVFISASFLVDISLGQEYRAICDFNSGCTLQSIGQSCAAARDAFLVPVYGQGGGEDGIIAAICFFTWCAPEMIYDAVVNQDEKLAYLDLSQGYSDAKGTHAFYTNSDCNIEVLLDPSMSTPPDTIKINSDQCKKTIECTSLNDVIQLINGWKEDTVPLATVIDAINKWEQCGKAQGASPDAQEQQKKQLMSMIQNPT